jgi:hypothetical protein
MTDRFHTLLNIPQVPVRPIGEYNHVGQPNILSNSSVKWIRGAEGGDSSGIYTALFYFPAETTDAKEKKLQ